MRQHLKDNFLKYTLTPLFILMVAASYYRFTVLHDFIVSYEVDCDPTTEICYVLCEDEAVENIIECPTNQLYHYAIIERYGDDLIRLCGETVDGCEAANACTEGERGCTIYYCDPRIEIENCTGLSAPASNINES